MAKNDRAYYLKRLKRDFPHLHAEVEALRMTVNEARKLAGLGATRTPLHELRNAWQKASIKERKAFISWLKARISTPLPKSTTATTTAAFDADGKIAPWAKKRVMEILARRGMTSGDLAVELGGKRTDTSVVTAFRNDNTLNPVTAAALEAWLATNASV